MITNTQARALMMCLLSWARIPVFGTRNLQVTDTDSDLDSWTGWIRPAVETLVGTLVNFEAATLTTSEFVTQGEIWSKTASKPVAQHSWCLPSGRTESGHCLHVGLCSCHHRSYFGRSMLSNDFVFWLDSIPFDMGRPKL
ncbi:hypothetical protein B0T20DRAFT_34587 [Sordaria brevicollis]|uniref:Secreted protein n=1 Tax=Sordaria brevicollis TaxID=83679 RepID=A0AAE0U9G5_SORBR|nr:hypothetical protein B0T20DRAFT_34587 [Sordaria brevicollis]